MSRKKKGEANYLDFIPEKNIDHEESENGTCILLRPKFMKGPLARWLQPHLKRPYFRIRLDETGSAAWKLIDGKRSILEIADRIYEKMGDSVEPRYERLSRFIGELHRGGMLVFKKIADPDKPEN